MIQAVVFDMDGLMFDTERMYQNAWKYAAEQMGICGISEFCAGTIGRTSWAIKTDFQREFGRDPEELLRHVEVFKKDFFANNAVPVKKGLYELLEYLKLAGCRMGIASSSPYQEICYNIKDAGIEEFFSDIVSGEMVAHSKPAPDPFAMASDRLGIHPSRCLALEDSNNGIRSAHAAGLIPVMVPDLLQPEDNVRPLLFAKLPNLLAVIELVENENAKT